MWAGASGEWRPGPFRGQHGMARVARRPPGPEKRPGIITRPASSRDGDRPSLFVPRHTRLARDRLPHRLREPSLKKRVLGLLAAGLGRKMLLQCRADRRGLPNRLDRLQPEQGGRLLQFRDLLLGVPEVQEVIVAEPDILKPVGKIPQVACDPATL